jgi:hypothetical protein
LNSTSQALSHQTAASTQSLSTAPSLQHAYQQQLRVDMTDQDDVTFSPVREADDEDDAPTPPLSPASPLPEIISMDSEIEEMPRRQKRVVLRYGFCAKH